MFGKSLDRSFIGQIGGLYFVVRGIDMISKPAAYIVFGVVAIVAIEMRGRK